jgi:formylglycine-generating enzyme required for sulfatase activity
MLHCAYRLLLSATLALTLAIPATMANEVDNVYWFRSDLLKANFYTINVAERDAIIEILNQTWQYRGPVWSAYPSASDPDTKPVFRFYRASPPGHFFTISAAEKANIEHNMPGWQYEGIAWYAFDYPHNGTDPVYRFWIPYEHSHFFTMSEAERERLLNQYPDYIDEGIAWYAYPMISNQDPAELLSVPGGCFALGDMSGTGIPWVCIDDFLLGRHEVTQGFWEAVMGRDPARWFYACADCPVEMVSWHDIQMFLERLNDLTGRAYRLPTEAEWEYACRSGGLAQTYCGGEDLDTLAWYDVNAGGHPHPFALKAPNGLGLFDMSGNVMEWTCSLYEREYAGAEQGCGSQVSLGYRVARGGSWAEPDFVNSSTYRVSLPPSARSSGVGLRLAHDQN